jgi:hypothetical protein
MNYFMIDQLNFCKSESFVQTVLPTNHNRSQTSISLNDAFTNILFNLIQSLF